MGGGGLLTPSKCFLHAIPRWVEVEFGRPHDVFSKTSHRADGGEHFFRKHMLGDPNDSFSLLLLFDGSRGGRRSKTHDAAERSADFFIDLGTLSDVLSMFMRPHGFSYLRMPSALFPSRGGLQSA